MHGKRHWPDAPRDGPSERGELVSSLRQKAGKRENILAQQALHLPADGDNREFDLLNLTMLDAEVSAKMKRLSPNARWPDSDGQPSDPGPFDQERDLHHAPFPDRVGAVLGLAHGLDVRRPVARNIEQRATALLEELHERRLDVLLHRVDLPLELDTKSRYKMKMHVAAPGEGVTAATGFEVLGRRRRATDDRRYALVRCSIETGRQHQIRLLAGLARTSEPVWLTSAGDLPETA